jgi:adenosylcobyric acid synthase
MDVITECTAWPALGLIRHFHDAHRLPAEDAVVLDRPQPAGDGKFTIAVPRLAHIANFDDLDPLRLEPSLRVIMVAPGHPLPGNADLVILPGSKATLADLADFRRNGWDIDLRAHLRRGGRILGLCAGYQMLGQSVADPDGIEGLPDTLPGLGLLNVQTILTPNKTLTEVTGTSAADGTPFRGYEMHIGRTEGPDCDRPLLRFADGRPDGAISRDGNTRGTYMHGLFADDRQRAALMSWFGARSSGQSYETDIDRTLDALAHHLAEDIDLAHLLALAG